MRAALLCLCLLGAALPTPVPLPLDRASGNCAGQHRILLKGCNTKHGFYVFKYVYSFSTRRNQTQIKKEEADERSAIPSHRPGEEDGEAPGRGGGGSYALEDRDSPKPENYSTTGSGRESHAPRLGASARVGPTLASSEGSGDVDSVLVEEVNGGEDVLPQSIRPGGPHRHSDGGDGGDTGAWGVLVDGAVTARRERDPTTGGAGDEGSGDTTVPGRAQPSITHGAGTGDTAVSSVTEKEDVRVDAEGMDEFVYIPDVGSVTIARGQVGSAGVTQLSPEDEVKIFIGRANIHVGEHGITPGSISASSEDGVVPTVGTIGPQGQPEEPATMGASHHGDSITSSPRGGHSVGDGGGDATAVPGGQRVVVPGPGGSSGGDITVTTMLGGRGDDDSRVRGEGQRFGGRSVATTGGASSVASLGLTTGDCSTVAGMLAGHASESAVTGRGTSGDVGTASRERARARARPEGAGLGKAARTEAAPSPSGSAARPASGRAPTGDAAGIAVGAPGAPRPRGSPRLQAQRPSGSKAVAAGGFVRLRGSRRLGGPVALERSRQLDQVRHADELHLRERALYSLGGAGGSPPLPPSAHAGLWSADSSQSSEGERGSRSESGEEDGRGAAGFRHGPSMPL